MTPPNHDPAIANVLLLGGEFHNIYGRWYVKAAEGWETSNYGSKYTAAIMFLRRLGYGIGWNGELERL